MALYLANELFDAMSFFSSNDVILTEILMTRSNAELEQIRLQYLKGKPYHNSIIIMHTAYLSINL